MNKNFIFISLLAVSMSVSEVSAQTNGVFDPYTREPLPSTAPEWMREIADDPLGVNYFRMDSLFNNWLSFDINTRVKTLDKKQAVNFYRRWMKANRPYVGGDGFIHLPTMKEHIAKLEKHNRRAAMPVTRAAGEKRWRNIGPFSTKRGESKPQDYQACVYRLTVYPKNPDIVYCGTETGVIFKSIDKGMHWTPCNAIHNFGGSIFALQVDPNNANTVFAGGGQNLWKSTDCGDTWTLINGIYTRVNSIRINPNNSQNVTLTCGDVRGKNTQISGFYVSNDGGQTFRQAFQCSVSRPRAATGKSAAYIHAWQIAGRAYFRFLCVGEWR